MSSDRFEIVCVAGVGLRVATGDHRASPEPQHGLAALVDRRDLERDDTGGRASGLWTVLAQRDHAREGVQRVPKEHRPQRHESTVEKIGLDALRGPSRLPDRDVDRDQRMYKRRIQAGDGAACVMVER